MIFMLECNNWQLSHVVTETLHCNLATFERCWQPCNLRKLPVPSTPNSNYPELALLLAGPLLLPLSSLATLRN